MKPGNSGKKDFIQVPYSGSKMADTRVNAEKKLKPFRWVTGYKIYARKCTLDLLMQQFSSLISFFADTNVNAENLSKYCCREYR
jgi:hypothetical protein